MSVRVLVQPVPYSGERAGYIWRDGKDGPGYYVDGGWQPSSRAALHSSSSETNMVSARCQTLCELAEAINPSDSGTRLDLECARNVMPVVDLEVWSQMEHDKATFKEGFTRNDALLVRVCAPGVLFLRFDPLFASVRRACICASVRLYVRSCVSICTEGQLWHAFGS